MLRSRVSRRRAAVPAPPPDGVVDYELNWNTGVQPDPILDEGEGSWQHAPPATQISLVQSPAPREGAYAMRAAIQNHGGDANCFAVWYEQAQDGERHFYSHSILWPTDYVKNDQWGMLWEWVPMNQDNYPGPGRLVLYDRDPAGVILGFSTGLIAESGSSRPGEYDTTHELGITSYNAGTWNDFLWEVFWSSASPGPSCPGYVKLWHKLRDDVSYVEKIHVPNVPTNVRRSTLGPASTKLNFGLYEGARTLGTGVVYHDAMRRGTTFDAVKR